MAKPTEPLQINFTADKMTMAEFSAMLFNLKYGIEWLGVKPTFIIEPTDNNWFSIQVFHPGILPPEIQTFLSRFTNLEIQDV